MERIEIAEAEKREEGEKSREGRRGDGDVSPVHAPANSPPGQGRILDPDREHRAGKRHAVVLHERQEPWVDGVELIARQPAQDFVVRQHDARRRNGDRQQSAAQQAQAQEQRPEPGLRCDSFRLRRRSRFGDNGPPPLVEQGLVDPLGQARARKHQARIDQHQVGPRVEAIECVRRLVNADARDERRFRAEFVAHGADGRHGRGKFRRPQALRAIWHGRRVDD